MTAAKTANAARDLSSFQAPYAPADGYQLVLQDMAEKNPKAAQANVKDYIDTRFIKELEDSGFIKALYRK